MNFATSADAEVLYSRILSNPDYHYGKEMALAGTVDTIFSPRAFTLESPNGVSDRGLLILADREVVKEVSPKNKLRVTGTLRKFERAAAEERIGRRLADEEFERWEGKPVLFLKSASEWQATEEAEKAGVRPHTLAARACRNGAGPRSFVEDRLRLFEVATDIEFVH